MSEYLVAYGTPNCVELLYFWALCLEMEHISYNGDISVLISIIPFPFATIRVEEGPSPRASGNFREFEFMVIEFKSYHGILG